MSNSDYVLTKVMVAQLADWSNCCLMCSVFNTTGYWSKMKKLPWAWVIDDYTLLCKYKTGNIWLHYESRCKHIWKPRSGTYCENMHMHSQIRKNDIVDDSYNTASYYLLDHSSYSTGGISHSSGPYRSESSCYGQWSRCTVTMMTKMPFTH